MRTLVLVAAAGLVLAAPAGAKELVRAELCGPAGCATVTDREDLELIPAGEAIAPPPPLGEYYELVVTVGEPDSTETHIWTSWYVADADMVAFEENGSTSFHPIFGESITFMKRLAARVRPFPAPRITAAFVGGKRVEGDPATYARLFSTANAGTPRWGADESVPIDLRSAERTPWTNGGVTLYYWPGDGMLQRGTELIRLTDDLAHDLAAARALDTAGDGRTLLPWLAAAVLLVTMLLLAALGAYLRPRTSAPAPASS